MDTSKQLMPVFGVPKNIYKDFSFQTDVIISDIDPGSSQITAESSQIISENSQITAESSQIISENSQNIAGSSQTIAGSSQTIAESSQTIVGSSQITAENSQIISENSQNIAGSSQTIVGSSQITAESSQIISENSQNIAGSSQTIAGITQTIAGSGQTIAGSSQTVPESSQKCNLCDRKFSMNNKYLNHIAIHAFDKENPRAGVFIKCSWCPNMFQSQIHLDRHIILEHRVEEKVQNRHMCHICSKTFYAASTLRLHSISHIETTNYNCDLCSQSFSTPEMLARHKKYKHVISKHMTVNKRHTYQTYLMLQGRIGYYHCELCPQKFDTKDELKVHELTHTREGDRCNMKFDKRSRLVSHRNLVHKNYHKQYQCTICHERFLKKSHLGEHSRKHNQKLMGRYYCHPCGTAFAHKCDLRAHQRTHLDKIAIKCPKCSQFFYSQECLEGHSSVHSMEALMSSFRVELADQLYGTKPDGEYDELVSEFAKASLTAENRDAPSASVVGGARPDAVAEMRNLNFN